MSSRLLPPALALLSAACTSAAPPPAPPLCPPQESRPAAAGGPTVTAAPAASAASTRVAIDLVPVPASGALDVVVIARGAEAALAGPWSVRAPDPGAIRLREVRDARGPLEVREDRRAGSVTITLARRPEGELRLSYTAQSRVPPGGLPWVLSDPNHLEVSGEALLLPDALESTRVAASIRLMLDVYGTTDSGSPVSGGATSFGIGAARDVEATVGELRRAVMVAGRTGTAVFDTLEGHDEAAWLGYTAFDPRPVAADVASFRTAAGEVFGEKNPAPETLLIVPDQRPVGAFAAARRTRGVVLHVGVGEPWSGPVRIAVAACVLHAWIGERLWIGPEDPAREAEGLWFSEGVTRHLARDLLLRFGLLAPTEVADEMNGLEGVVATSPRRRETNAELALHAREPGTTPLVVARGALYAQRVDAAIRKKSGGKRSLTDVVRALYTKARDKRGPLPTSAWVEAVSTELGAGEAAAFTAMIERGGPIDLDGSALGPCFRREARRFEPFDLGFDEAASRASTPPRITGVRPGGPADRAGLRDGDLLIEATIAAGRSDVPVTVMVERGGEQHPIRYRPAGPAIAGRGWARVKDVPDEACTR
ncbi:hypothetical protein [Polyangium aurulentum]|uniref:hypothetical protein n=1 Tax=Polyangium aurulentum TaxID=2567896 RepID=UPI0010AEBE25|nr:hypothetical protein [Polyangium aurulentum]UQA54587.1 hypothetical protein E8A73_024765 [Polyangium aurulentum]